MTKKATKRKKATPDRSSDEVGRLQELGRLRRVREIEGWIRDVQRQLRRIVNRAGIARLETARALVEDTGYGVFDNDEIDRITKHADEMRVQLETAERRVRETETAWNDLLERARRAGIDPFEEPAAAVGASGR